MRTPSLNFEEKAKDKYSKEHDKKTLEFTIVPGNFNPASSRITLEQLQGI